MACLVDPGACFDNPGVMVDPGLLGDVRQGQLYLQLDAIDESDRIW